MTGLIRASVVACGLVLAAAGAAANADEKLGAGVTLAEATPIKTLYESPEKYVGKTIRVDGVVTAVCEQMGCWMALAPDAESKQVVRFKVDHGVAIVFPIKARGKQASAEGVFEAIASGDAEAKEAAQEQAGAAAKSSDFSQKYQIKALGAVIK